MSLEKNLENVENPSSHKPESFTDKLEANTEVEKPDSVKEREIIEDYLDEGEFEYDPADTKHEWDYSTRPEKPVEPNFSKFLENSDIEGYYDVLETYQEAVSVYESELEDWREEQMEKYGNQ